MHHLYIKRPPTAVPVIRVIKAIRRARAQLGLGDSLRDASTLHNDALGLGWTCIGSHESLALVQSAADVYREAAGNDCQVTVDPSDEDVAEPAPPASAPPATVPTDRGYRLALVQTVAARGDLGTAIEAILSLKVNTDDPAWDEAIVSLAQAFPWIKGVVEQNGMWPA